ncbi:MAG: hypothetical protein ABFC84_18790 [Veillonellales bacterium]
MIPWLLVLEIMSQGGKPLSVLMQERMACYPISGEINSTVANPQAIVEQMEEKFAKGAVSVEHIDGLSVEFDTWRFNVRLSNTEPVLRLNVETKCDPKLLQQKTEELLAFIRR